MTIEMSKLKERLKEAFGSDSQEAVANKLNMTQGNVSKLLSGMQQPTLDTLYRIADIYDVSIDWLMGLSDRRHVTKPGVGVSYALATEVLNELISNGSKLSSGKSERDISIQIKDPILIKLVNKSRTLFTTDFELYQNWKKTRLSMFDDKSLLWASIFQNSNICFLASQATNESNFLELYEEALREQKEYEEVLNSNPGPFGD